MPGITYKFENQHLTTFEDNFRFMGEQPFTIYFDLETTYGKRQIQYIDGSEKNMCPVSYCFIVAFHPALHLERITILRSFNDSFARLNDISYLPDEMIRYFDRITTKQLQSFAEDVLKKKNYYSLIEMFNCKLKFVIDIGKKWVSEKYLRKHSSLEMCSKQEWKKTSRSILGRQSV